MEKKNFAVIGYGGIGSGFHCRRAEKSDVLNLVGIYDVKPERREKARADGVFAYETMEALLSDPKIELVTVATPNNFHKDIVIAALEAGKHVVCEKPAALSSAELEEMIAASERTGKLFTVHQNRRWDTDKLRVADLCRNGRIGRIVSIESRVHGSRGIPGDWRRRKEQGGGMVLDWGVHLIDQAIMIFEGVKVTSVYARLDHITSQEVDDGCHIVLGFENGVFYTVEVGTNNYINLPRFYVRGTAGTAVIDDWNQPLRAVVKRSALEKDALPIRAESGLTKTMAPRDSDTVESFEVPVPESDVHDFYRNFCRAIDGKEPQIVTHEEMRRVMKLMETVFESAGKNQVIHTEI